MEYYSAVRRKELLIHTIEMNLTFFMLSGKNQTEYLLSDSTYIEFWRMQLIDRY